MKNTEGIMNLLSIALLLFGWHRAIILLSFFFNALAYNLESGSDDAYVYDLLQTRKEEQQFAKVKEIREILLQCALLLTDLVVGWGYIMLFLILPFRMAISYLFYYYSLQHRG